MDLRKSETPRAAPGIKTPADQDLGHVIEAWPTLSAAIRNAILAMIGTHEDGSGYA